MIEALAQTVDVPLWLVLGLAGYHRAIQMGHRVIEQRRARDRGEGSA